jgi:hypothetical protein
MLLDACRVPPAPRRVGVAERAVVVPDRSDIIRIGLEEELRRVVDAARSLATVRAVGRFTRLVDRTLDIERLFTLIAPEIVASHASPSPAPVVIRAPSYPMAHRTARIAR